MLRGPARDMMQVGKIGLEADHRDVRHEGDMSEESRRNFDVFISYSSKDKKWADATCAILERHRIRCWVAPRDITPGTEWGAAIISGMDASKIMVLVFSSHANESAQVRREVERAISKGLIVLPFRVENVSPAGAMEYALSNTHWLDGFTKPVERQFDMLASSVEALLAKSGGESIEPPVVSTSAPEPRRAVDRRLIGGVIGAVVLLVVVAGLIAIFRGGTGEAKPIGEAVARAEKGSGQSAQTDEDRIQGRWQVVEQDTLKTKVSASDLDQWKPIWTFRGVHLTTRRLVDGAEVVQSHGSFSLRPGGKRNLFDVNGSQMHPDRMTKRPNGAESTNLIGRTSRSVTDGADCPMVRRSSARTHLKESMAVAERCQ